MFFPPPSYFNESYVAKYGTISTIYRDKDGSFLKAITTKIVSDSYLEKIRSEGREWYLQECLKENEIFLAEHDKKIEEYELGNQQEP